jgi:hypothetical protein
MHQAQVNYHHFRCSCRIATPAKHLDDLRGSSPGLVTPSNSISKLSLFAEIAQVSLSTSLSALHGSPPQTITVPMFYVVWGRRRRILTLTLIFARGNLLRHSKYKNGLMMLACWRVTQVFASLPTHTVDFCHLERHIHENSHQKESHPKEKCKTRKEASTP